MGALAVVTREVALRAGSEQPWAITLGEPMA
jgi:hypothetical protein